MCPSKNYGAEYLPATPIAQMPFDLAWFQAARRTGVSREQSLAFLDSLAPVEVGEMHGRWRGYGFYTGHMMNGLLEEFGWYGKELEDPETVRPPLFGTEGGGGRLDIGPVRSEQVAAACRSTIAGGEGSTPVAGGIAASSAVDARLKNSVTHYDKVQAVNSARRRSSPGDRRRAEYQLWSDSEPRLHARYPERDRLVPRHRRRQRRFRPAGADLDR